MNTFIKKNCFWLSVLLVAGIAFLSCAKNTDDLAEGETVTKDYIMVEDNQSFTANTTSYLLNVQSNCNWTLQITNQWEGLSFDRNSYTEATGNAESINIVVTTAKNNKPDDRSCTLVFSNADGTFKRTITLTQTAGDFNVEMEVDPTEISVIAAGEKKDFVVNCNTDWTVEVNKEATWCILDRATGTERQTVSMTIQPNQTNAERQAKITIASGNRKGNKVELQVTVTQSAATLPDIRVDEAKASLESMSISGKISFDSMYDVDEYGYYLICPDINLSEKHQVGTGGGTKGNFSFTVSDNIEDGRVYYIRAYATSVVGVGYSNDYPVTIKGDIPGSGDNNKPNLSRKK
ncbi:MAG: BACON domain-containing protein [Prevotella sp.]|nr:BACON domain-containing protein [Prevotella sp.]